MMRGMVLFRGMVAPVLALSCIVLPCGCAREAGASDGAPPGRPCVYVSIPPQAWLVRELSCGRVDVEVLLPDGRDPHVFEPSPRQTAALSEASAYLLMGLPFETHVRKIVPPRTPFFFDLSEGGGAAGAGDATDPHLWLTPDGMRGMAERAAAALDAVDPDGAEKRRAAFSDLSDRLGRMDAGFAELFAPHAGKPLLVRHPAWARFAARYGIRLLAIEEDGREASMRRLVALVEEARACGVKTVFSEPHSSRRAAEAVARQLGGTVEMADPLSGDWEENLRATAAAFAKALEDVKAPGKEPEP
jgi:zinc transport system substrate-binding protein